MSGSFTYRPKYVDIRVKKPAEEAARPQAGERPCDHVGCARAGLHPAPKGRDRTSDFWFFCAEHAGEYNRRWNYFAGMSDEEFSSFARQAEVGHRPTWSFKASRFDREAAAARDFNERRQADPYGFFRARTEARAAEPARRASRLEQLALEALALDETADSIAIRARYAELVKRYHPDSNGGDRTCEALLEKTVKAYQVLKASGRV